MPGRCDERKGSRPLSTPALSRAAASCARTASPRRPCAKETLRLVLARLDDMKAEDTVTIDLTGKSSIARLHGRDHRPVAAPCRRRSPTSVVKDLHEAGVRGVRVEGMRARRLGADRRRRRHRPRVPAGGARLLQSRKDVVRARPRDGTQAELIQSRGAMRIVVAAVGRLKQGPETRACRALPQARRADRPQPRLARRRNRRNPRKPRRRGRQAHARGIDRARQHHSRRAPSSCCSTSAARISTAPRSPAQLGAMARPTTGRRRVFVIGGADGLAASLRDKARPAARVRRRDLAAPARARHAAGAALPRRHHPGRPSLSPRLAATARDWRRSYSGRNRSLIAQGLAVPTGGRNLTAMICFGGLGRLDPRFALIAGLGLAVAARAHRAGATAPAQ